MKRDPVAVAKVLDESEPVTLEVLAPNLNKDYHVTPETLRTLAENFRRLWHLGIRPPLRLGHLFPDSPIEPPSVGTIAALDVKPGADGTPRLFAEVVGAPKLVRQALASRLYTRTSAEVTKRFELTDDERNLQSGCRGEVLTGVTLCGHHVPRIKALSDIIPLVDDAVAAPQAPLWAPEAPIRASLAFSDERRQPSLADLDSHIEAFAGVEAKYSEAWNEEKHPRDEHGRWAPVRHDGRSDK